MTTNYTEYGSFHPPVADDGYPYPVHETTSYNDRSYATASSSTFNVKAGVELRDVARTPSPTPSEQKELKSGMFDWKTMRKPSYWFRKEWAWYYVIIAIFMVITALVSIYHTQIVHALTPVTRWLHGLSFGWLVPIAVLFVLSFPPLFGHEIVAILCGLVWGLWVGFAIVIAGSFLGEVGNFYAFKWCCRARGEKLEKTEIPYACLAKVVREGGFKIALIARLSAIPGHFTTAVFSTCGMSIIVFSIAAILSMPKQFITVYLGVVLEQSATGVKDKKSSIISDVVLAITFIITIAAMWYIYHQMALVKPQIIYERRKARQGKLARAGLSPYRNPDSTSIDSSTSFDPHSEGDIPLTSQNKPYQHHHHQQWDSEGRLINHSAESSTDTLHAPHPQYAGVYPKDEEERGRSSTDEVGWSIRSVPNSNQRHPYANPDAAYPPGITKPQQQQRENAGNDGAPRMPLQLQPQPQLADYKPTTTPTAAVADVAQTPTQASYVINWEPPSPAGPLPLPPFPSSPFDDPMEAGGSLTQGHSNNSVGHHGQEPTDATFYSAVGDHSREVSEVSVTGVPNPNVGVGAGRAYSSPPPGYVRQ